MIVGDVFVRLRGREYAVTLEQITARGLVPAVLVRQLVSDVGVARFGEVHFDDIAAVWAARDEALLTMLEGVQDELEEMRASYQGALESIREHQALCGELRAEVSEVRRAVGNLPNREGWGGFETPTGRAAANELHDFAMVLDHCIEVYKAASGGRISKPTTLPSEVVSVMERLQQEAVEQVVEERDAAQAALAAAEREVRELRGMRPVERGCADLVERLERVEGALKGVE